MELRRSWSALGVAVRYYENKADEKSNIVKLKLPLEMEKQFKERYQRTPQKSCMLPTAADKDVKGPTPTNGGSYPITQDCYDNAMQDAKVRVAFWGRA